MFQLKFVITLLFKLTLVLADEKIDCYCEDHISWFLKMRKTAINCPDWIQLVQLTCHVGYTRSLFITGLIHWPGLAWMWDRLETLGTAGICLPLPRNLRRIKNTPHWWMLERLYGVQRGKNSICLPKWLCIYPLRLLKPCRSLIQSQIWNCSLASCRKDVNLLLAVSRSFLRRSSQSSNIQARFKLFDLKKLNKLSGCKLSCSSIA